MRVLTIQNHPGAPLGRVGAVLAERGVATEVVVPENGSLVPADADGYDGLVVLGGPMSAVDDDEHPYLADAAALIGRFAASDKPVLGICLGAQLVARACGARPLLNVQFEFGYTPILATDQAATDPLARHLVGGATLMEWHRDSFDLPPGSVHLARSADFPMQGFRIGRAVYGFQFHFEATPDIVEGWLERSSEDIAAAWPDYRTRLGTADDPRHAAADAVGRRLAHTWIDLVANRVR